jgi:thioredoxin reductase
MMREESIVILGGNISGNTAAIYASMSNDNPLLLHIDNEKEDGVVGAENYIGLGPECTCEELSRRVEKQANKFKVRREREEDPEIWMEDGMFVVEGKGRIRTKALIITTREMRRKIERVEEVAGRAKTNVEGLFLCGSASSHCDGEAIMHASSGCMAAMDARWFLDRNEGN